MSQLQFLLLLVVNDGASFFLSLPQGIVGRHYLLSFRKGWSGVSYAKGDNKGSIEAPFQFENSNSSYHGGYVILPGHFTQLGRFLSKFDYSTEPLVFAQFFIANKDMEPELVCMDSSGRANGMGVFGGGGLLFSVSLGLVRRLLSPHSEVLSDLQQLFPCELVVGMNGRLWVKSSRVQQTLVIAYLLQSFDTMTAQQRRELFRRVAQGAL